MKPYYCEAGMTIFHADCRAADGRMNSTVLDMRNCPSNQAENRNGSLVCR
jgi:hypothetical protein